MNDAPATPAATPTPTPTPTLTPSEPATPTPQVARYTGEQQMAYIKAAQNEFLDARTLKTEPFAQAKAAFNEAGGATMKGLTSKEAIATRRTLIANIAASNEGYLSFLTTQNETYRQALAKTPLMQSDVDSIVAEYGKVSKEDSVMKLRQLDTDLYKAGDEMLAFLDKSFGSWSLKDNRTAFKKPGDANAFNTLAKKYNSLVEAEKPLLADLNPPLPTAGASPIASVAPSPAAATSPTATVAAPTTSPAAKP